VSTRLIGGVIMTHGDDSGLVLPPNIAPHQVVIVPIPRGDWKTTVLPRAEAIRDELVSRGVRVKLDASEENSPGWKFAEWELRGVPLRLEIGPKDIEKGQVFSARRDTREKAAIPLAELGTRVPALLEEIQQNLLARAKAFREEHTSEAATWSEFTSAMEGRPGFVIAAWCGSAECEAAIKAETQATLRNVPLGSPRVQGQCVKCNGAASVKAWFAKAY
jgi:prolyl-tRNA synthetase